MRTTPTDPIIAEVRAVRAAYAARFDYDVEAIFRDIRARQEAPEGTRRQHGPGEPTPDASVEPSVSTVGKDDEATFGYYMVGVFDVLGQSRKLRDQAGMPLKDDRIERQRVVANLKDTAGVVIGFRRLFRQFFEAAAQHSGRAATLPEPQRAEMVAAMTSNVMCWGVSDSIFVAVPLTWTRHPAACVADVFRSLTAAASMWLVGLSTDHPIRGGMEIGTGMDIEPGEIYGQGLEAAYRLESKVAGLPRIVVGPTCVKFLEAVKRSENAADAGSKLAASSADLCLSMLREDADGNTVVDGLGQTMLEQSREIPDFRDQFSRAYDNIRAHCRDFRGAGNTKLASRYELLRAYFDERASKWGTTPKPEP